MVKSIKAKCTVLRTGKPGSNIADELFFDDTKSSIRAGKSRMNLSDVKRVNDSKGKVSVTSSNMSFVLDSTPETRNLSESIRVAAQKRDPAVYGGAGGMNSGGAFKGIGRGESGDIDYENNQRAPGSSLRGHGRKGLSHSTSASSFSPSSSRFAHVSRKGGAFQPSNTLGLSSRKPGGVSGSARGKTLAGLAASSPGQRASLNTRGGSLGKAARSFGHGGGGTGSRIASSMRNILGHRGSGTITRRSLIGDNDRTRENGDTSRSTAGRGRAHDRGNDGGGKNSGDNDDEVSDPEGSSATPPRTSRIGCGVSNSRAAGNVGGRLWTGTSIAAGMGRKYSPRTWTQALRFASSALPWAQRNNVRRGLVSRYVVHHEPQWRREGFRNTGNTCYINAVLQGLLSLSGFTTDLQRKCWVQAMLTPPKKPSKVGGEGGEATASSVTDIAKAKHTVEGGVPGDISAGLVSATASSAACESRSEDWEAGGGAGGDATLYAALLRLAMQARGSHGVMDASQLKRAIDRHSDRFAGNLQQDAHEFLVDLINTLYEETQSRLLAAAAFAASTATPSVEKPLSPAEAALISSPRDPSLYHGGSGSGQNDSGMVVVDLCSGDEGKGNDPLMIEVTEAQDRSIGRKRISVNGGNLSQEWTSGVRQWTVGEAEASMAVGGKEDNEADSESRKASLERILPTTRHFHAEVEVTLTCTRCAYSRRRRELYRDFSLDVPHHSEGGEEKEMGLSELLDGFFKPSVLKLRCELCDNDQVQVEHSLAQLPGALILHIKRFSPLFSSPEAPAEEDAVTPKRPSLAALGTNSSNANRSSTAAGVPSTAGSKADLPLEDVHSCSEGSGGRVSDGQSNWSGTRGEVSYVKLMAPVSIPKELDLERFCSSYTANSPADELGETIDSLEEMCNPSSRIKSDSTAVDRPEISGGEKRRPDGDIISVDLSLREGWLDRTGGKRLRGEDGTPLPVEDEEYRSKFPPPVLGGVLADSTNIVGLETPGERRRRALKDKENINIGSKDRWSEQDSLEEAHRRAKITGSGDRSTKSPGPPFAPLVSDFGVENTVMADLVREGRFTDGDGNIDYGRVLSFRPKTEDGRRAKEECVNDVHGGALTQKIMLERDADERRQVEAALCKSRIEALAHGAAQEEQDVARALMLSQKDVGVNAGMSADRDSSMVTSCEVSGTGKAICGDGDGRRERGGRKVVTSSSGTFEDLWECGACTLHNKWSSSCCEVCDSPKPPSAPWIPRGDRVADSPVAEVAEDQGEEDAASPPRILREGPLRARYQLQGVLHHLGRDAFAGHYVTDVREVSHGAGESKRHGEEQGKGDSKSEIGRWKRHDDSIVSPVSEATALDGSARRSAYICFYSLM